jgi:transposase
MQAVRTIGLGIAKSVFQAHGVDAEGKVVIRRQLRRGQFLAFFQKLPLSLVGRRGRSSACSTRSNPPHHRPVARAARRRGGPQAWGYCRGDAGRRRP